MHLAPHIAIAAVSTLGAAWLMITAGLQKSALERKQRRRVCPSCGRQIQARVCASCSG
jgi:formate dehydrogenase maturation protein FdhE